MIDLLLLLLNKALLWDSDRENHRLLLPVAVLAYLLDVAIFKLYWGGFVGGVLDSERTISDTLERICKNPLHPRYVLCREIALEINRRSPNGDHIKAVRN